MKVTVAICTWNRSLLLDQTLAQLCHVRVPTGVQWELLVVNNNCGDETDRVIARHAPALPLRRLFEPRPGLSHARNHAVREAAGDYIVWTDDDVLVDEGWLEAYCAAFRRWPDAAVFGGPIQPWFDGAPPTWLTEVFPRVATAFAARDLGARAVPLAWPDVPFGANMAFRAEEQRRCLYDPDLGVRANDRVGGEETILIRQILDAGGTGWWVPEARVRHFIPAARQSVRYLRSFYAGCGKAWQPDDDHVPRWFGRPRWAWRSAVVGELRYRVNRLLRRHATWVEDLITASTAWGILSAANRSPKEISRCAT